MKVELTAEKPTDTEREVVPNSGMREKLRRLSLVFSIDKRLRFEKSQCTNSCIVVLK